MHKNSALCVCFERVYIFRMRRHDKSTAQMARYFYHDKFPLETCISNATSHFITKWHKKSRKKVATFFLTFYGGIKCQKYLLLKIKWVLCLFLN